jgi:hypothetical protein
VGSQSNQIWRSIDENQVDIRNNGFLTDFLRARENCRLQALSLNANNPITACTDARFNPAIAGSQQLTVFPKLPSIAGSSGLPASTAA